MSRTLSSPSSSRGSRSSYSDGSGNSTHADQRHLLVELELDDMFLNTRHTRHAHVTDDFIDSNEGFKPRRQSSKAQIRPQSATIRSSVTQSPPSHKLLSPFKLKQTVMSARARNPSTTSPYESPTALIVNAIRQNVNQRSVLLLEVQRELDQPQRYNILSITLVKLLNRLRSTTLTILEMIKYYHDQPNVSTSHTAEVHELDTYRLQLCSSDTDSLVIAPVLAHFFESQGTSPLRNPLLEGVTLDSSELLLCLSQSITPKSTLFHLVLHRLEAFSTQVRRKYPTWHVLPYDRVATALIELLRFETKANAVRLLPRFLQSQSMQHSMDRNIQETNHMGKRRLQIEKHAIEIHEHEEEITTTPVGVRSERAVPVLPTEQSQSQSTTDRLSRSSTPRQTPPPDWRITPRQSISHSDTILDTNEARIAEPKPTSRTQDSKKDKRTLSSIDTISSEPSIQASSKPIDIPLTGDFSHVLSLCRDVVNVASDLTLRFQSSVLDPVTSKQPLSTRYLERELKMLRRYFRTWQAQIIENKHRIQYVKWMTAKRRIGRFFIHIRKYKAQLQLMVQQNAALILQKQWKRWRTEQERLVRKSAFHTRHCIFYRMRFYCRVNKRKRQQERQNMARKQLYTFVMEYHLRHELKKAQQGYQQYEKDRIKFQDMEHKIRQMEQENHRLIQIQTQQQQAKQHQAARQITLFIVRRLIRARITRARAERFKHKQMQREIEKIHQTAEQSIVEWIRQAEMKMIWAQQLIAQQYAEKLDKEKKEKEQVAELTALKRLLCSASARKIQCQWLQWRQIKAQDEVRITLLQSKSVVVLQTWWKRLYTTRFIVFLPSAYSIRTFCFLGGRLWIRDRVGHCRFDRDVTRRTLPFYDPTLNGWRTQIIELLTALLLDIESLQWTGEEMDIDEHHLVRFVACYKQLYQLYSIRKRQQLLDEKLMVRNHSTVLTIWEVVDRASVDDARFLLYQGVNWLEVEPHTQRTALHLLAFCRECIHLRLAMLIFLIDEAKLPIDGVDAQGETPLMIMASEGQLELLRYMVERGNFRALNNLGQNVLHRACLQDQIEIVLFLHTMDNQLTLHHTDHRGATPLHLLAEKGHFECACQLLQCCKKQDEAVVHDKSGHVITSKVQHLLLAKDFQGRTPIHITMIMSHCEMAELFLTMGGIDCVMCRDHRNRTLLHYAVEAVEAKELVSILLKHGADLHAVDERGDTALHSAAFTARTSSAIVRHLLVSGADPRALNNDRETPADIAVMYGLTENYYILAPTSLNGGRPSIHRLRVDMPSSKSYHVQATCYHTVQGNSMNTEYWEEIHQQVQMVDESGHFSSDEEGNE